MKKLVVSFVSLALCAVSAFAAAAADSLYSKGDSFQDTILKTRENYLKWADAQKAKNAGLKFGEWKVSQYFEGFRKNTIKFADPVNNKPSDKFVFGREPLWKTVDIRDAEPFALHSVNTRLLNGGAVFLYREITADTPRKFVFTAGSTCNMEVRLNGKVLQPKADAPKYKDVPIFVYECDLTQGKNELSLKIKPLGRMAEEPFYFAPYDDAALALYDRVRKDYSSHMSYRRYYYTDNPIFSRLAFIIARNNIIADDVIHAALEESMFSAGKFEPRYNATKGRTDEAAAVERIKLYGEMIDVLRVEREFGYDVKNVRAAMQDIKKTYPEYDKDGALFAELAQWEKRWDSLKAEALRQVQKNQRAYVADASKFKSFADKALLANPLLKKYPNWVMIKRDRRSPRRGLPNNWQGNSTLACQPWKYTDIARDRKICDSYKDELFSFNPAKPQERTLMFKPAKNNIIADLDISFDGKKILFSTIDDKMYFRLDELDTTTGKTRTLTPSFNEKVDYFDGIYLPDGRIMFCSTACWVGVPCVAGQDAVANLYVMDPEAGDEKEVDKTIRQLTFEQDADWMPTLMENGRIMYTRWEYVDNSHYFSRILMHMNPDGTAQSSLYGSTSYWPNSLFYARQIPGDPNKFVGIASGHHGMARAGELHLFDISKGTKEESGRVHQYPTFGRKYVAETKDELVRGRTPMMIHPYPLSENYVVASAMDYSALNRKGLFAIYLVDKFDNMTLLQFDEHANLFEPMPLVERQKPAEIADKTNPDIDYGYVFLNDIYQGDGLKDVPRGTVKSLRILEYHYAYRDMGSHDVIANEGSWDVKRIHGTVPVLEDGSAMFKVPANRPMALQPLDKDGKALALMRSWFTVMPGEVQSCVGCHEGQGMSPTSKPALASRSKPSEIKPFIAGVRGYSFIRDVQPVLDKYCSGCHDGSNAKLPNFKRGVKGYSGFPQAYLDLARFVRRSGPECNQNMLAPLEFNADTSELMHILKKGHKGVKLDDESMQILTTWIDLNVPCYGTWREVKGGIRRNGDKMREMYLAKYANRHDDQNAINYDGGVQKFVTPAQPKKHPASNVKVDGFPFDAVAAAKMQAQTCANGGGWLKGFFGGKKALPKELEAYVDGSKIRFVLVPAGSYVMGTNRGFFDEGPAQPVKVKKPFYMSRCEISNAQFAKFDPTHNSGYQDRQWKDHVDRGYPANLPNQPVVRVNWNQANSYCSWLSDKLGVKVSLPTEKQWEWAARAGTDGDFWFGKLGANYGACENLADYTLKNFAVNGVNPQPRADESPLNAYTPYDVYANDGQLLACDVGSYKPNAFGLCDMLGNVSEWTADDFTETLGGKKVADKKTVRGGSWRDRAKRARVSIRRDYHPWQKVYNVGVRLVINDAEAAAASLKSVSPLPLPPERDITPRHDNVPH